MIIRQTYKLDPTESQKNDLSQWLGQARFVWNHMLNLNMIEYKDNKKFIFAYDMNNLLPIMKRSVDTAWLKGIPSQCLQQKCQDLDTALKSTFKSTTNRKGFPKFKSRKTDESGIRFPKFTLQDNKIFLPKMESGIKIKFHRQILGECGSMTIIKDKTGCYYASILVKVPDVEKVKIIKSTVGIDLGINTFAMTSDSQVIDNPKFGRRYENQVKKLHRYHSKKKNGSKNKEKSRLKLARKYKSITNKRKNFLHQTASSITKENDLIAIEDLNVKGLLRNHHLSKSISDVSWGSFTSILEWHCIKRGNHLVKVGRWFPSSKLCSCCHNKDTDLKLSDRIYNCKECGLSIDRDLNAAFNIRDEGIRILNTVGTTEIYACGDMNMIASSAQETIRSQV